MYDEKKYNKKMNKVYREINKMHLIDAIFQCEILVFKYLVA